MNEIIIKFWKIVYIDLFPNKGVDIVCFKDNDGYYVCTKIFWKFYLIRVTR